MKYDTLSNAVIPTRCAAVMCVLMAYVSMALAVSHGCLDVLQHHTICQLEKGVSVALWGL